MAVFYRSVQEISDLIDQRKLADLLWQYEYNGKRPIDSRNAEYRSWKNSLPILINCIMAAGLGNLTMSLEYVTPLDSRIDAVLLGEDSDGKDQIALFELKQWSQTLPAENISEVQVPVGRENNGETLWENRQHPVQQLLTYKKHLCQNHKGLSQKSVKIQLVAFLHNYGMPEKLCSGKYLAWKRYENSIYGKDDFNRLTNDLKRTFTNHKNADLLSRFLNGEYVLGDVGFKGLTDAMHSKENAVMISDQVAINSDVYREIEKQTQDSNVDPELIIVSGGPGTGKTIIGLHFIYDFSRLHPDKLNAEGAVYALPRSKTVQEIIRGETGIYVPFMDKIPKGTKLAVIDEGHRIGNVNEELKRLFLKTKLVIILQDDRQRIRLSEHGTVKNLQKYANDHGIKVKKYQLKTQKRSGFQSSLVHDIDNMFYKKRIIETDGHSLKTKVYDRLADLDEELTRLSRFGRVKWIAPFDWDWSRNDRIMDIRITDHGKLFEKAWNPLKGQYLWYCSAQPEDLQQVGSIYTTQGLEFEYTGIIWWKDLVWNDVTGKWVGHLEQSKDVTFVQEIVKHYHGQLVKPYKGMVWYQNKKLFLNDFLNIVQADQVRITEYLLNTYRVLLSRATKGMGIWFEDDVTRRYVEKKLRLD